MKAIPKISKAEWDVMKIVWDKSPCPAQEIIDLLSPVKGWKPKTIKSLISRLVNKEALGFHKAGKIYSYYPRVTKKECARIETKSFLNKVYDGALKSMLTAFIQEEKLSLEEIEELKKILEEKEHGFH